MSYFDRNTDLQLPSLDFLGNSDKLEAEVRRKVQSLPDGWRTPQRQMSRDASGAIIVIVDSKGVVLDVGINPRWSDRLSPDGFAQALYQTYIAATGKAYEAAALTEFIKEQRKTDVDRAREQRDRAAILDQQYGVTSRPEEYDAWLRSIWDDLYAIDEKLHQLERGDADASAANAEKRVSSPNGYLTMIYEGRTVSSITGDIERIRGADSEHLRSEAVAAFRAVDRGAQDDY